MSYSQGPLIELLRKGNYPGETGVPKHILTDMSNVFLFEENVYKLYKNNNKFFNEGFHDISEKEERFDFTKKDFEWNHKLSPSVYERIAPVEVGENGITLWENPNDAEELLIVMKRVNTDNVLYERLMQGTITEEDAEKIGAGLGEQLKAVQEELPDRPSFYTNFKTRLADLRHFISSVQEHISADECGIYCEHLESFTTVNKKLFENELTSETVRDGDFHSHNIVYENGVVTLIDTYPPKDEWSIGHRLIPVYRIGVDIWALSGNKKLFDAYIKGYESTSGIKVDRGLDALYVPYAACLAVTYLYILQQGDPEKKAAALQFHDFVRKYFDELTS